MTTPRTAPADLDQLADVLATYRTCELATIPRSGTPVAWPTVCWLDRAAGTLVLTTSVGLPRKAFNVRRDPRVALLFSDPTASGRTDLPQVLVQGTAVCPDEVRTSPQGLEGYWQQLWRHQPAAVLGTNPLERRLMDFYHLRLVITVTPAAVTTRPPLVRSGRLAAPRPARSDTRPSAVVARQLPRYADAVLATVRGDELPRLRRVRPVLDPVAGSLLLEGAEPAELDGVGTANLLLHGHDERLAGLRQLGLVGDLEVRDGRVALQPTRVLGAPLASTPWGLVRTVRGLRRTAHDYLERRGLPWPEVPWAEYRALRSTV